MIRVMVVDDERPALRQAERVLRTFADVQVCGLFTDADKMLERLRAEPVDLVLLDIEMPGAHGLELARIIHSSYADVCIAFVTAYDAYAVDAFDAEAIDYVLKPLAEERVQRTLHRCLQWKRRTGSDGGSSEEERRNVSILCFGRFTLTTSLGGAVKFRNSKAEELLAYLVHHNGKPVGKAQIMEALWQGRDRVRTQANLHSTAYQLRKDLEACGLPGAIEQSKAGEGSYRLHLSLDACDLYDFEQACRLCRQEIFDLALAERAAELYRNGYLKEHDYGWALGRQTELEFRYTDLLEGIADEYARRKRYRNAVLIVQKWAELLPFNERIHARMIALHLLLGNSEEARKHWAKTREMLNLELGISLDLDYEQIAANPQAAAEGAWGEE